ncbi:hypothetical protein D046_2268B, partial [Vibrio parahaemolyticus V-223/04]
CGFVSHF